MFFAVIYRVFRVLPLLLTVFSRSLIHYRKEVSVEASWGIVAAFVGYAQYVLFAIL